MTMISFKVQSTFWVQRKCLLHFHVISISRRLKDGPLGKCLICFGPWNILKVRAENWILHLIRLALLRSPRYSEARCEAETDLKLRHWNATISRFKFKGPLGYREMGWFAIQKMANPLIRYGFQELKARPISKLRAGQGNRHQPRMAEPRRKNQAPPEGSSTSPLLAGHQSHSWAAEPALAMATYSIRSWVCQK